MRRISFTLWLKYGILGTPMEFVFSKQPCQLKDIHGREYTSRLPGLAVLLPGLCFITKTKPSITLAPGFR
ncbi:hypothetical protein TWF706_003755 [Orbilia oligospora]|nr:hypothetical protein TWF706_003755 [Orbilia oligospora]